MKKKKITKREDQRTRQSKAGGPERTGVRGASARPKTLATRREQRGQVKPAKQPLEKGEDPGEKAGGAHGKRPTRTGEISGIQPAKGDGTDQGGSKRRASGGGAIRDDPRDLGRETGASKQGDKRATKPTT